MASNTIHVFFEECEPAPPNGYRLTYRPQGSDEDLRTWPTNFNGSPAIFIDTLDPLGTQYEGFIQGDCGDVGLGVPVPWQTGENSPATESPGDQSPTSQLLRINNFSGLGITGVFTIPVDGEPADSREVTCDEGYPLAFGQTSNGSIHPDHDGDANLSVLVFFDSVASIIDRVHVIDSDAATGCNSGNGFAAVIGVTGPFRFNNAETWEITVNNTAC
jgi:hypothetical protein